MKKYITSSHTLAELLKGSGLEPEDVRDGEFSYRPTPAVQWALEEVRSVDTLGHLDWKVREVGDG